MQRSPGTGELPFPSEGLRASLFAILSICSAVAFGTLVPDLWRIALLVMACLLGAGYAGPVPLLQVLLLTAGISLAPITANQRSLLPGLGGLNLDGLRLLATLAGFCWSAVRFPNVLRSIRQTAPYLVFLAYAGASLLWSNERTDGVRLLLKLCYPICGFLLAGYALRTGNESNIQRSLAVGVVLGSLVNFMINMLGEQGTNEEWFAGRYRGGIGYNLVGHFSAMTGLALYGWWRSSQRIVYLLLATGLVVQAVATGSRAAFVSLAVGLLVYEALRRNWRGILAGLVGAVAVWLTIPTLGSRTGASSEILWAQNWIDQVNLSGRVLIWADVWTAMVNGAELWGHGLGSTTSFLAGRYETIRLVHNEYLRVLAELGVIGLAALLVAYSVMGTRLVMRSIRRTLDWHHSALAASAFAVFLVASFAENTFEFFSLYSFFPWLFAGLALREVVHAESRPLA